MKWLLLHDIIPGPLQFLISCPYQPLFLSLIDKHKTGEDMLDECCYTAEITDWLCFIFLALRKHDLHKRSRSVWPSLVCFFKTSQTDVHTNGQTVTGPETSVSCDSATNTKTDRTKLLIIIIIVVLHGAFQQLVLKKKKELLASPQTGRQRTRVHMTETMCRKYSCADSCILSMKLCIYMVPLHKSNLMDTFTPPVSAINRRSWSISFSLYQTVCATSEKKDESF